MKDSLVRYPLEEEEVEEHVPVRVRVRPLCALQPAEEKLNDSRRRGRLDEEAFLFSHS